MAMKKRYHRSVLAPSQSYSRTLKRTCMLLHTDDVASLERRPEMRTILSVIHVSLMSITIGAFIAWMSASTHLERSKYVLRSFQMRADRWHATKTGVLLTTYVLSTF